jgi:hypothetical protein
LLAGLLFDGFGNRMTPSHAVKNGKRYRYYISNNLIAGANAGRASMHGEGVRLAAHEIEGHVIRSLVEFLTDDRRVITELCASNVPPAVASAATRNAALLGKEWAAENCSEHYEVIRTVVSRVDVVAEEINVRLDRLALSMRLGISSDVVVPSDEPLTLRMTCELRRLGKEKRLIVAAHEPKTRPDPVLIKAVVRANRWFALLREGAVGSITELAEKEKVQRSYASRLLTLAFLAPDITEAILDGRQPIDLSLDRLLAAMPLPLSWEDQRRALRFVHH